MNVGSLHATLGLDSSGFSSGLRTAEAAMSTAGVRLPRAATLAAVGVGVALATVGAKAVSAAREFETSMAKIVGLVGVSREQVNAWAKDIQNLAPRVGRGPQELADALFFITSAGLTGAAAMEVLESSAKAAAVGLGNTSVVADLVTSAVNAYGTDVLSAAKATDDLTMAVRLGKLEPDALAGAMGRVLPLASAMGVEFHEVAAGMAAMSRTGTDANEAATALRGILAQLLSPTDQARQALAGVGLSVEGVQQSLRDDGLLATLELLVDAMGGNVTATEAVFGNIRALSGVMDMLGSNAQGTRDIFDEMTRTTGTLDDAFSVVAETTDFKVNQAMAAMQGQLLDMGATILPSFVSALEAVMPVLMVLVRTLGFVFDAINMVRNVVVWMVGDLQIAERSLEAFGRAVELGMDPVEAATKHLHNLAVAGDLNAGTFKQLQDEFGATTADLMPMLREIDTAYTVLGKADDATILYVRSLLDQQRELQETREHQRLLRYRIEETTSATERLTDAQQLNMDRMREATDPIYAAMRAVERYREQQERTAEILADSTLGAEAHARAQVELAITALEAGVALDTLASSPEKLEEGLDALAYALGTTRQGAIDLLEQLGLMDGMVVRGAIEISAPTIRYSESIVAGVNTFSPSVVGRQLIRHAGGVIPGLPGSVVPILARAGEEVRVRPGDRDGMGEVHVHVTGRVDLDGEQVGELVMDRAVRTIRHRTGERR